MLTIAELLQSDVGLQVENVSFAIKTKKKKWADPDGTWTQQVLLTDKTGDMLADVFIEKNIPLVCREIHIISAEVQYSDERNVPVKKLYIDQFSVPTQTADDYGKGISDFRANTEREIKGKIATWLAAGKAPNVTAKELLAFVRDPDFKAVINEIMNL